MTITPREKALAAATLMALLYGVLGLSARGRVEAIRQGRASLRARQTEVALAQSLIAQRDDWRSQYAELGDLMPVFDAGRRVDTHWLGVMDRVATHNGLSIIKRQIGEKKQAGNVYEMPIECKEWEGTLDALVGFLYELQAEGAMLDLRQMYVKPSPNNPAKLRGSFTLYCAYMRTTPPAPPAAGATP